MHMKIEKPHSALRLQQHALGNATQNQKNIISDICFKRGVIKNLKQNTWHSSSELSSQWSFKTKIYKSSVRNSIDHEQTL